MSEESKVVILLVEDNPGDVLLTREALKDAKVLHSLEVVQDGVEASKYLYKEAPYEDKPRPDIIFLDLNMPKKDGRTLLKELKSDSSLRTIPVVIMTTSKATEDIVKSYDLHANCYVRKPIDLDQFIDVVKEINNFWLHYVELPKSPEQRGF